MVDVQYWMQQPVTWGLALGGGLLIWQLLETFRLQSRVDKNSATLRAISDKGQASSINVERRLQSLQSQTSNLPEIDQRLQNVQTQTESLGVEISQAQQLLGKVDELQTELRGAIAKLNEAEGRFDSVQTVYRTLSDAQKYVQELEATRGALEAASQRTQNVVYKEELDAAKQEILNATQQLLQQEREARRAVQQKEEQAVRATQQTIELDSEPTVTGPSWIIPATVVGIVVVTGVLVAVNWNKERPTDPLSMIERQRRRTQLRQLIPDSEFEY